MGKRVIIERKDTGAQISVDESAFKKHYPDVAYKVIGEETDASFGLVGVPKQKRARPKPKAKGTAPKAAPVAREPEPEPIPGPAPESETRFTPPERGW